MSSFCDIIFRTLYLKEGGNTPGIPMTGIQIKSEEDWEMKRRYCMEIGEYSPLYYYFAYFDNDEYLADFLFAREEVNVTVEGEYGNEDEPFHIIQCRIPKAQREAFLRAIDDLPEWMSRLGKKGYDSYCIGFLRQAAEFAARRAAGGPGNIPLP